MNSYGVWRGGVYPAYPPPRIRGYHTTMKNAIRSSLWSSTPNK
ncbi:unnamed protein product [Musa acuminata subsp. malaccensis]|uniref:(wild Malaysian banana) hypothetical protein n=1 Tax=Musa acuminata subsp. malaccensis TaxID=214687 RepID=A0A804HPJ1_MUSAM|nr:unnamed protein product [Musa acuminata subsp. malaccensis]